MVKRFCVYFDTIPDEVMDMMPHNRQTWKYTSKSNEF